MDYLILKIASGNNAKNAFVPRVVTVETGQLL